MNEELVQLLVAILENDPRFTSVSGNVHFGSVITVEFDGKLYFLEIQQV